MTSNEKVDQIRKAHTTMKFWEAELQIAQDHLNDSRAVLNTTKKSYRRAKAKYERMEKGKVREDGACGV